MSGDTLLISFVPTFSDQPFHLTLNLLLRRLRNLTVLCVHDEDKMW